MKQDQRGFSLVELVVVVAIMAVLAATVSLLSFSTVTRREVRSCAAEIEVQIEQAKLYAMSHKNAVLYLWSDSNGVYVQMETTDSAGNVVTEPVKTVGEDGIDLKYIDESGPDLKDTASTSKLTISFDRSSGAFKPFTGTTTYCNKVVLKRGDMEVNVVLVSRTGKCYVEE